jgi:hypothetical protein
MFTFPVAHFGGELSFTIDQSLRFNDGDTPSLSRTIGTPTSTQKFTFSAWIKPSTFFNDTASRAIFSAATPGNSSSDRDIIGWENDKLNVAFNTGSWNEIKTTQVFRDPASWYHIMVAMDTTQATASNRTKIYVNGSQVTDFSTAAYVSQNDTIAIATSGKLQAIGAYAYDITTANDRIDGYLAQINFVDGQALTPDSFAKTTPDGVYQPVKYAGAYGTNGFRITGADSSDLGEDFSGNNNDFTSSGLAAADQMSDSPTANHCTLNPLWLDGYTLSDGNLVTNQSGDAAAIGTMAFDPTDAQGFYFEAKVTTAASFPNVGIRTAESCSQVGAVSSLSGNSTGRFAYTGSNGQFNDEGSGSSYGSTWAGTADKVIGVFVKAGELFFSVDGTIQNSGTAAKTGLTGLMVPTVFYDAGSGTQAAWEMRFDASDWSTTPSGYKALTAANLPNPTIADPSEYFQTTLYSGNGSTQSINQSGNSTFEPSWVWIKARGQAYDHALYDAVRGATKELKSNATDAQSTITNGLTAFESDGFALGDRLGVNQSGENFVAWQWRANGAGASNGDGSITSTVSADATSGFSIIRWTGTAANGTIGHGLGVKPSLYILKNTATTNSWLVGSTLYAATSYLSIGNSDALATGDAAVFNSTHPTSSVINLGSNVGTNGSSGANNMICYAFAEVPGFSKISLYEANSNNDGPFINCNFRPSFVLIKNIDAAEDWWIQDAAREPFNGGNMARLSPNSNGAEADNVPWFDFVSNGLKVRYNAGAINSSGTHIFMAFAESPFKHATAR